MFTVPDPQIYQEEIFYRPLYFSAEISRFVKISQPRVHRWLEGYQYFYQSEVKQQPPLITKNAQEVFHPTYASFYDLIDLLFIKHFLDYGISLQKLRKALAEAEEILGTPHFVHQSFFTDGSNICLLIKEKGKGDAILELLSGGQWVIKELIQQLAHQIDFDKVTNLARRWFPPEGNQLIVLDPLVCFGKPAIFNKGITTENVYDLYIAEQGNKSRICKWLRLDEKELDAAINFESRLVA